VDSPLVDLLLAFLAPDRAAAILGRAGLPQQATGAVLFSDISGFTPLTEAVIARFGARRGGEEFTDRLNEVYDALIAEVERYGGNIIGFAGDAMAVWFPDDDGLVAVATGLAMQQAMARFARVVLPDGETVALRMKVGVCAGSVRRFVVGDPAVQCFDVVAGRLMELLSACEGAAERGEVVVDGATARRLEGCIQVASWRPLAHGDEVGSAGVVEALRLEVAPRVAAPLLVTPEAAEHLRPWVAGEVYRRLASGQGRFLTELRPAAAMFVRFGGIDFEHDPAAPEKLDAYVRWVQKIIARLEGILVQLTVGEKGSYLYAAFGAPIAHDDDTTRAFVAALEILHPPPEIRAIVDRVQIGVTRGTMRTGAYGGHRRRTYGVLGDEVNLAARLMARAGPNEILVTERAARRRLETFDLEALAPIRVKGKSEPIPVHRLLGRRQATGRQAAAGARVEAPMVGRVRELAELVARLERARDGRGQVVSIAAEAGMGKTRLVAEVMREAAARGFAVFVGDCPVLAREASYSVWIPIVRALFDVPADIGAEALRAGLEGFLTRVDPELVPRAPLLGPLFHVVLPDNDLTRTLEGKTRRASMDSLFIECLRHHAWGRPLLLVLEECHWIDAASRHLLRAVLQAMARWPVAVLLAHRPVPAGELLSAEEAALDYASGIELGDLPPEEARQLVTLRLAGVAGEGRAVPEALIDLVTARASGNPFFIEEVANLLKVQRLNLDDPRSLESLELPDSLHSLILGRIDQLTEDAQTTLKVASVIGRLFRAATLFGVHPLERGRQHLPAHLQEMRGRDVVVPEPAEGEEAYLFRHIVMQEVAYESLPFALRATIHEAIGAHLERLAGEDSRPYLDLLAFHFDRGRQDDKKRRYLVAAGDEARRGYALTSAISYYERALAVLAGAARIDVLVHLADVLELRGRWNDAFARYREARALAEGADCPAQRATIAGLMGDLFRRRGEFAEAGIWLERARQENADQGNDSGVALMLHLEGTLAAQMGRFESATQLLQSAANLRERLGEELSAAKSLNNLGIVARSQGDVATALAYYERSLAIRRRLNERREVANSLNNLGFLHRFHREFDRARDLLEESVKINRAIGDRWSTANALSSLAELALDIGDADLAGRCLKESIVINRELGDRRALAYLLESFGHLGRLRREGEAALLFFAAARSLRAAIGAPLEPADAEKLEAVVKQIRRDVPPAAIEHAEIEGGSLPLGEVLDRATTAFA
jgi:class 3 adenylate cyclase/tetratricopeptide (TPR) repeat protein